jgi:signal transduction histidine kinase/ligand-binding sensor domain-containing protein/DNA-binding response OmpR family regulator
MTVLSVRAVSGWLYTAEKLSSSTTNFICQDQYGYIWVGTQFGLNKFDGYRFTHYYTDEDDSTTIQGNEVTCLFADSKNRLWVGGARGLSRYDHATNQFVRYRFPTGILPRIECIYEDRDGNILVCTSGYGLYSIRSGRNVVTQERQFSRNEINNFPSALFEDDQHCFWWGCQTDTITRAKASGLQPTAIKDFVSPYGPVMTFLRTDARGFLCVCAYGILRYDYVSAQLTDAGFDLSAIGANVSVRAAMIDHAGNVYIGTSGRGLFVIPKGSKTLQRVESGGGKYDLSTANVNNIFEDKDQNLWVSCSRKGLLQLNQRKEVFRTWKFSAQNIQLGSSLSSLIQGDDGALWCTVQKSGIYRFDADGKITQAPASPSGANCIYRDSKGNFWVGSENTLYSYNPFTGASTQRLRLDGWGINCMADDGEGHLYVCNYGKGFSIFDTATGQSESFSMYHIDPKLGGLCNDWVKAFLLDSRGLLWIATTNGVCVMNPADRNFRILGWDLQLKGVQCFSLCEQNDGSILIGTETGLYQFDRSASKVSRFKGIKEVDNKPIYAIVCSQNGDIWMSSANGIWQYDQRHKRVISHVGGNGLEAREFILGALATDGDGRVSFGSIEGIVTFYPDEVSGAAVNTDEKVTLTNFVIDGKPVGCLSDTYKIPYDRNSFSMEFSLLDFSNSENVNYEYRINGGQWIPFMDGSNSVAFSRMNPGHYEIEVRAMTNGTYYDGTLIVNVVVQSPWYASTWAYLLYALLAVGAIILIGYYRERRRRADLDEQKMRFLINATHDIRSPLTLIMGPLNKLKERITDKENLDDIQIIDRNAQRLLLLVNQILDERKIDKNQMHLHCSETDLVAFVTGICSLFQFNARQRNIRFTFEHEDEKLMAWIDRIQFDKVVTNLLSNAFKYTYDGGEVRVILSKNGKSFSLRVVDNGLGFKEENTEKLFERFYQGKDNNGLHIEGTGIGLNLSRAIVLLHGGSIKAYNRKDGQRGACLDVELPLGKEHLKPEEIVDDESSETQGSHKQGSRNFRLLVVDDDLEVAQYIKNELGQWYRIDTAPNGREALKKLLTDSGGYDLVISDVMMPEMDGISMLRQLKGNPNISDIPVILLTSKVEVSDRLEGLRKGADAYLAKPFNMEELHILVDNLVDNVRRLRGKFSGAQTQEDKMENVEVKGNNDQLMERIMQTVNEHLQDPDFNVDRLCEEVGLSRTQLHRKMKEITGISTGEFIRNLRLQQAARLIREGKINIAQVAYSVGFNNQTYFSTVFKKHFGRTPTEYADEATGKE